MHVRITLALSLAANMLLGATAYQQARDNAAMFADRQEVILLYEGLLIWACDHGNGGHECGEVPACASDSECEARFGTDFNGNPL
jgi:hypothetical protein